MADGIKLVFNGVVRKNYLDGDSKKRTMSFYVNPKVAESLEDIITKNGFRFSGENYPIKQDDSGEVYIKTSSSFPVITRGLPKGCDIEDVGANSTVSVRINMKEGSYKKSHYVSAYLLGLEIKDMVMKESYDCFDDDEFTALDGGSDNPFSKDTTSKTGVACNTTDPGGASA